MKTPITPVKPETREWFVIDASDKILGRLASTAAHLLIGKNKPHYSPHQDHGDNVIIINADKIRLSGKKSMQKSYFSHSRYVGGVKNRSFREQMENDSTRVIENAVRGMIPKNKLGRSIRKKLHVYSGETHPHAAQNPKTYNV